MSFGVRDIFRLLLALLFLTAGILHFAIADRFAQVVPPYLPHPFALVYVSGVCEILGGVGVLIPAWRRVAGWGLIALLVAVFPANLSMALGEVKVQSLEIPAWVLWVRLPFQGVLIAWVWWCSLQGPPTSTSEP
jgi:uncharacterized membrane protein